jgi:hypothetical protein
MESGVLVWALKHTAGCNRFASTAKEFDKICLKKLSVVPYRIHFVAEGQPQTCLSLPRDATADAVVISRNCISKISLTSTVLTLSILTLYSRR